MFSVLRPALVINISFNTFKYHKFICLHIFVLLNNFKM